MSKKMILIHRTIFIISILILTASLIFYLIKWNSLPDEIGMHFAADGQFDVVASKFYGFYPHLVGYIFIAGFAAAHYLINRIKTGFKISSKGEQMFRTEFHFTLDILLVLLSLYFALWSYSVALQIPLDVELVSDLVIIMLLVSMAGIASEVITYLKFKEQKEKNAGSPKQFHKLCRLIPWMLTAAEAVVLFLMWERIPSDKEAYYGLAYFSNFDAYLDKRLLLIPHFLIVALLVLFEIISAKAIKANKKILVDLTDKLKLISGVFFFWWDLLLVDENRIGIFSVCLFVFLCTVFFIIYLKRKKSDAKP